MTLLTRLTHINMQPIQLVSRSQSKSRFFTIWSILWRIVYIIMIICTITNVWSIFQHLIFRMSQLAALIINPSLEGWTFCWSHLVPQLYYDSYDRLINYYFYQDTDYYAMDELENPAGRQLGPMCEYLSLSWLRWVLLMTVNIGLMTWARWCAVQPRRSFAVAVDLVSMIVLGIPLKLCVCKRACVVGRQTDTAIILLHGCSFNWSEWIPLMVPLWYSGYGRLHALSYEVESELDEEVDKIIGSYANMGACRDVANGEVCLDSDTGLSCDRMRLWLRRYIRDLPERRIIFIGHSMGGLVAKDYDQLYSSEDNKDVCAIITLGTPWQGSPFLQKSVLTWLQRFGQVDRRYWDMSEDSEHMVALRQSALKDITTSNRRFYGCITSRDDVLVPGKCGVLPIPDIRTDNYRIHVLDGVGHYVYPMIPEVWRVVDHWVKRCVNSDDE